MIYANSVFPLDIAIDVSVAVVFPLRVAPQGPECG